MNVRNGWTILQQGVGKACIVWMHKGHKKGKWEERGLWQSTFIRPTLTAHLKIASQADKIPGLLSKKKILLLLMNVLSDQDGCPL